MQGPVILFKEAEAQWKLLRGSHAIFFCVRQDYEELEKQLKEVFKERSNILHQLTKTSRELDGIKVNLQVRWKLIFLAAKAEDSPHLSQWINIKDSCIFYQFWICFWVWPGELFIHIHIYIHKWIYISLLSYELWKEMSFEMRSGNLWFADSERRKLCARQGHQSLIASKISLTPVFFIL